MSHRLAVLAPIITLVFVQGAAAVEPAVKCDAGKLNAVGKYANCRLQAESKAVKKGLPQDYSKCVEKFSGGWTTLEAKGAGQCTTNGDYVELEAATTVFSDYTAQCLGGPCPRINPLWCHGDDPTVCALLHALLQNYDSPCGYCLALSPGSACPTALSPFLCSDPASNGDCNSEALENCARECCGRP